MIVAVPQVLYVEPDEVGIWPERTIRLRVPKICARDARDVEVRAILLGPTEWEVVEASSAGQYREYVIHIRPTPALEPGSADGRLRVEAGCSTVEIPVRFAGLLTEED